MGRRVVELTGVVAVVLAVFVLLRFAQTPVSGQATATGGDKPAAAGPAPKTEWGEPDIQGIWTNEFEIPLQRPAAFADKPVLTEEERAEMDKKRSEILGQDSTRYEKGSERDVGSAYNAAIFLSHKPTGLRTSLIVDPPDGKIPPLTPEAQKRQQDIRDFQLTLIQATEICKNNLPGCAGGKYGPPSPRRNEPPPHYIATGGLGGGSVNRSNGPEDRSLGERCMAAQLPDLGGAAGFFPQIVQSPGAVSISYDTGQGQSWQRVIPISNAPHLPSHIRQWWGDSRGRWEGNTLVVDVTNFSPKTDYQGSRENLHLVERWTRIDANRLEYEATLDDPTTWTKPWTVKVELARQPDQPNRHYREPRCHEGNYGMTALLAGARLEEREFKAGRGPDPATLCTAGCGGFAGGYSDDGTGANPLLQR